MASISERTRTNGESTWAVLFRHRAKQTSRSFDSAKEAEKFRDLVNLVGPDKAISLLDGPTPVDERLTVDQLFEKWIVWKTEVENKVTPRTLKDYRRDYDNWIRRQLGDRVADTLDERDIQNWVDEMGRTLEPKSVADRHMMLGQMYRFGTVKSRRIVDYNPCTETQLPEKRQKAPKGFTLAQWEAMREWAGKHEPEAGDLLLFLVSTGWRWSEATPLRVSSVEDYSDAEVSLPDGRVVVVPQVWVSVDRVVRRTEDAFVEVVGEAKSRAGVRRINLPAAAAQMVRRRVVGKATDAYLFTSPTGKRWHSTTFIQREFARILDGAGIEKATGMGPHYLRHTHVLMLDRAGVSAAKMQRWIGHEDIKTTLNVYGGQIDNTLDATELVALDALTAPVHPTVAGEIVAGEIVG